VAGTEETTETTRREIAAALRSLVISGDEYNLPVPDPTRLTTEAVDRNTAQWRRELETLRERFDERQAELAKAVELAAAGLEKMPGQSAEFRREMRADFDRQLAAQRELIQALISAAVAAAEADAENIRAVMTEKFTAVDTRFLERDTRTEQAAQESRISLDAALAAAKEAVSEQNKANTLAIGKSELATQKQIDAMVQLMTTSNKSLEDKIADVKTRLDRGEGQTSGATENRTDQRQNRAEGISQMVAIFMGISIVLAVAAIVVSIALHK
jgi:uncharacterized membrane-anchored protein YhcB (DUF1043 family)